MHVLVAELQNRLWRPTRINGAEKRTPLNNSRALERPPEKRELADQLMKYFAEVDARRHPASEEGAEDILTEAIRSSRPGFRPHQ